MTYENYHSVLHFMWIYIYIYIYIYNIELHYINQESDIANKIYINDQDKKNDNWKLILEQHTN